MTADQSLVGASTRSASQARRQELATFLRSRRQLIPPAERGFDPGNRRAPGLRREEVATLAGVSATWYTRLEQAQAVHPSEQVLSSLGRALSLNDGEVEYLLRLGGYVPAAGPSSADAAQLTALAEALSPNPASVITPSFDYVAWNRAAEWVVPGFLGPGAHNLLRLVFTDERGDGVDRDPGGPRSLVGRLRANAARHPGHQEISELADELSDTSPVFAELWRRQEVDPGEPPRDVRLGHPEAGLLGFRQIHLRPQLDPDLTLVVFLPADESTAAALDRVHIAS